MCLIEKQKGISNHPVIIPRWAYYYAWISKPKPNDTRFLDILDIFSLDMSYISPNLLEKTFTTRQHAFHH